MTSVVGASSSTDQVRRRSSRKGSFRCPLLGYIRKREADGHVQPLSERRSLAEDSRSDRSRSWRWVLCRREFKNSPRSPFRPSRQYGDPDSNRKRGATDASQRRGLGQI